MRFFWFFSNLRIQGHNCTIYRTYPLQVRSLVSSNLEEDFGLFSPFFLFSCSSFSVFLSSPLTLIYSQQNRAWHTNELIKPDSRSREGKQIFILWQN